MRNLLAALLVLLVFVTACTPGNLPDSTVNQSTLEAEQKPTATLAVNTQVPATVTLQPTAVPTLTPTPQPARFDQVGFRQFAITRSYFEGFEEWRAERSYSTISTSLSPDGRKMAISACWGSLSNVWSCETARSGFLVVIDVDNGDLLNEIPLEDAWPGPSAFSTDGNTLVFSTNKRKVSLWDLSTNKLKSTFLDAPVAGSAQYPDVAIAPDSSSFAAATRDTLYVWDPSGKILTQTPAYNTRTNAVLNFSADGSRLSVFSANRTGVDVYNTSDWTPIRRVSLSEILDADMTPDGRLLAAFSAQNNNVVVWEIDSGKQIAEFDPGLRLLSLKFNPAGDLLMISGYANLDYQDDYSIFGAIYETQTWSRLDYFYTYAGEGKFTFNTDGSRMVAFSAFGTTVWELPDAGLIAGLEVVRQFQQALADGDYDTAASLFEVAEGDDTYLVDLGIDPNDLAGSFSTLCDAGIMFCLPMKELVMMGNDWDTMTYMVRLEDPSGDVFTSPEGATIIYLYLVKGVDGQPRLIFPAMD